MAGIMAPRRKEKGDRVLLALISDTHLKDSLLPDHVMEALSGADLILHAGDILDIKVIDQLSELARTVAVTGNMDHGSVARSLPESRVLEVEGFKSGLTHGYGPPTDMTSRVRAMFDDVDCIVFGHTHQPLIEESDGVLFFNPGSPTDKMFAKVNTVGLLEVSDGLSPKLVYLEGSPEEGGA
jgi:putative phosphoesterase